ncbi:MAG: polysaccharide export protein [Candidatus Magnetominusculus sp. LBB02]|nr:polysaccharide export protein [Candidatus Magnetominusculus sp. LBB02]
MFNRAMANNSTNIPALARGLMRKLTAVLVLFFFGCSSAGMVKPIPITPENPMPAGPQSFTLGSGDVIMLKVFNHDELSISSLKIRTDGTISVPMVGQLKVVDMPIKDVERLIEEKLAYYFVQPKVSVNAVTITSKKIFVLGEVGTQSVITMEEDMTLLQAIAKSGGVTSGAKTSEISLIRGGQVYTVDLNRALKGDQSQNIMLIAGDAIYVKPTVISTLGTYFSAIGSVMGFLLSIESSIILTKQVTDIFQNKSGSTSSPSLSIPTSTSTK